MNRSDLRGAHSLFSSLQVPDPVLNDSWNRIQVPPEKKARLLRYLDVMVELQGPAFLVGLNLRRTLLFYGPPGTGKTSLARGLAHEWTRTREREAILLQVNPHAIPSSEHGGTQKNVLQLFRHLDELASPGKQTFVLCDEVESFATNRSRIHPETNPLDTLLGVNAFIEELDHAAARHSNVVFLLTSNLRGMIDRAVLERVDFSVKFELPDSESRLAVLRDALQFLQNRTRLPPPNARAWQQLAELTDGFSHRQLRHLVVSGLASTQPKELLTLDHLAHAARDERPGESSPRTENVSDAQRRPGGSATKNGNSAQRGGPARPDPKRILGNGGKADSRNS